MILKPREDRNASIAALERLMAHPAATRHDILRIREQIDAVIKGDLSEAKAAIELDTHYGASKGEMIIHDLRIELDGLVAQIDHLVIDRLLDVWVLESKRLANGIKVNENGECLTFSGRYPVAIDSPIEQNRRHVKMLERLFDSGAVTLPKRFGITLKPKLRSLVLIAEGRITRPAKPVPGIESLIRTDQLCARMKREGAGGNPFDLAKMVSAETVRDIGLQLVALHRPIEYDWERRFRMTGPRNTAQHVAEAPARYAPPPRPKPPAAPTAKKPSTAGQCEACEANISSGVKNYCQKHAARFDNRILCMSCQPKAVTPA